MSILSDGQKLLRQASHFYPTYTGLCIFCAWLYCSIQKKGPKKAIFIVGCLMLSNPVASYTLKLLIRQQRPFSVGYGMPSAHTFWAAGLGAALLLAARSQYNSLASMKLSKRNVLEASAYIACAAAPLIAVERVLSREHTMVQAAAGLLLGTAYSLAAWEPAARLSNSISRSLDSVSSYINKGKRALKK